MLKPIRVLAAAALLAGCAQSSKSPAPTTPPAASEATVVFTRTSASETRLYAQAESGTGDAVPLSPAGARAEFGGQLSSRRVLYTLHAQDGSVKEFRAVGLDGAGDATLGAPAAGAVRGVRALKLAGEVLLLQVARADGAAELLASKAGAALAHLANGRLLAVAGDQVAYLANPASAVAEVGDVRAVRLDGAADRALGAGGQDDEFHGLVGSVALLTARRSGSAEVRAVDLASGAAKVRAGSRGERFAGAALVAQRGSSWEKLDAALAAAALKLPAAARPLALLPDGSVAAFVPGTGLVAADDKAARSLDAFAAAQAHSARVVRSRLVYTANDAAGSHLRSALLDGSGAVTLASGAGSEMRFSSELAGSRVLFYRTKGTEPGGWLHSVKLEGGDERSIGSDASGTLAAADHDFGGVTRSGRIIFEAELKEHAPSQLFVVDADGSVRGLNGANAFATIAAIVE